MTKKGENGVRPARCTALEVGPPSMAAPHATIECRLSGLPAGLALTYWPPLPFDPAARGVVGLVHTSCAPSPGVAPGFPSASVHAPVSPLLPGWSWEVRTCTALLPLAGLITESLGRHRGLWCRCLAGQPIRGRERQERRTALFGCTARRARDPRSLVVPSGVVLGTWPLLSYVFNPSRITGVVSRGSAWSSGRPPTAPARPYSAAVRCAGGTAPRRRRR